MIYFKNKIKYLFELNFKLFINKKPLSFNEAEVIWKKYDDYIL